MMMITSGMTARASKESAGQTAGVLCVRQIEQIDFCGQRQRV